MIYEWALVPVLTRKDMKAENLLVISERETKFTKRYKDIQRVGEEINRILDENYKLYFDLLAESFYIKDESELASEVAPDDGEAQEIEGMDETAELG